MTTQRLVQFRDDNLEALSAIDEVGDGRGWCNLSPEVTTEDVDVLSVNVLSLRVKKGAPVASFVTSPPKRGERRPSTLGVLHTRGRLGRERIAELLGGAAFQVKQDHQQRGLLFEVAPGEPAVVVLEAMRRLLEGLCDYERTGTWRLDVYHRASKEA